MLSKEKSRYINDILLCIGILAVALIAFLVFKATMEDGKIVTVSINGTETQGYSLSIDSENMITSGKNGEFQNMLVIKDGKAYVREANCKDKICVSHRKISKVGETIVCLPHKVVISIDNDG